MYSIFHFFKHLLDNKNCFDDLDKLEDFPFDEGMLACKNAGQFPDLAIKLNLENNDLFTGGELIELKDSRAYRIPSFNSTIASGKKEISKVIKTANSSIKKQMEQAGNHLDLLPIRDVFYLIRGRKDEAVKIVLVHGSFFETVNANSLISQSFEQVLQERLKEKAIKIDDNVKDVLIDIFSQQETFSKVRDIDKAAVKLRFRIMTEVKPQANILNPQQYPQIKDNTISLIIPCDDKEEALLNKRVAEVFANNKIERFKIKHHLGGDFWVFEIPLLS
jgi:hypothetical protein